ncbi:MAG: CHAD domain-containing protein [Planctomycetota bacterium]
MIDPARRIRELREHAAAIRRVPDAAAVHGLRVAASRLSVWVELGGRRLVRDDLRWMRRAVAAVRDLDVVRAAVPDRGAFADRLDRVRAAAELELRARFDLARAEAVAAALERFPKPDRRAAARGLVELARRARAAGDAFASEPPTLESAHALRRRLRRLRHALDWLDVPCEPVRVAQDELGALCDRALVERELARASADGASPSAAPAHSESLEDELAKSVRRWERMRAHVAALAAADEPPGRRRRS